MRNLTIQAAYRRVKTIVLSLLMICGLQISGLAQGDGPHTFLLSPTGLWGVNPKPTFLSQNFLPSGDILIKNADINVNVFPTTFFHTLGIGGQFAQLMFMVNPGNANGNVEADVPGFPAPQVEATGFGDGFIGFKFGLNDAPALNLVEYAKHTPQPSMEVYFRIWYSGTYDRTKPLNLGTNRTTFEIGLPMAFPIGNNTKKPTWFEMYPSIRIYTANNEPTIITQADKSQQLPLFLLENHLTHNLTTKLWIGGDLRYQYGGALELDGVNQDNKVNILGGSVSVGYQLLPFLGLSANYGGILAGENGARSEMYRLSAVFVYANTKKFKQPAN